MASMTTISQLTAFSAVNRSSLSTTLRPQCLNVVRSFSMGNSEMMGLSCRRICVEKTQNSYPHVDQEEGDSEKEIVVAEQKRSAKIHDFCFGIPFGGLVLSGGVIGFVFSRNPATLGTGVLYGGALLALSTFSLKIWRQGKSCLPYILGQGALAAVLLWKNLQTFSLTKKVFPTGFYAAISAAMLCFYSYVLLSGGNPPPKKLKTPASVAT